VRVQGHGIRERQVLGPPEPQAQAGLRMVELRRYRCLACGAVTTVTPAEVLTRRLYGAGAIVWALALFGLSALSPQAVRSAVSPWRVVGAATADRWSTLARWCAAARAGQLWSCTPAVPRDWPPRRAAARLAAAISAYALPSPEPPALPSLAFHGALHAR